jgi:hypothetical protein
MPSSSMWLSGSAASPATAQRSSQWRWCFRIVGGAHLGRGERLVRLRQAIELLGVAAGRIRVQPLRQVAKHAVDRLVVGVRTELQQLVVVHETLIDHPHSPPDRDPEALVLI